MPYDLEAVRELTCVLKSAVLFKLYPAGANERARLLSYVDDLANNKSYKTQA